MKFAFYPGCSLESSAKEYRASTEPGCARPGDRDRGDPRLDLLRVDAGPYVRQDPEHRPAGAHPGSRRRMNTDGVLVSCASCYARLKAANHALKTDAEVEAEGRPGDRDALRGRSPGLSRAGGGVAGGRPSPVSKRRSSASSRASRSPAITGACWCARREITGFDDPENPETMDRLVSALGAEPVKWRSKVECCGAALAFTNADIVLEAVGGDPRGRQGKRRRPDRGGLSRCASPISTCGRATWRSTSGSTSRSRCCTSRSWWGLPSASPPAPSVWAST